MFSGKIELDWSFQTKPDLFVDWKYNKHRFTPHIMRIVAVSKFLSALDSNFLSLDFEEFGKSGGIAAGEGSRTKKMLSTSWIVRSYYSTSSILVAFLEVLNFHGFVSICNQNTSKMKQARSEHVTVVIIPLLDIPPNDSPEPPTTHRNPFEFFVEFNWKGRFLLYFSSWSTNPSENYARQNGFIFPKFLGWTS